MTSVSHKKKKSSINITTLKTYLKLYDYEFKCYNQITGQFKYLIRVSHD